MTHGVSHRKFGRDTTARKALLRGLIMNVIEYGTIETTLAKAKDLRSVVEKIITRAREDSLANRRLVAKTVTNPVLVKKLFEDVAPRFVGVNGGYTRVVKAGHRKGDAADMAIIQLTK
ncbi:MAG: 50S ribosomal protein L17 [Alphaproteobacteria bacterium CG_4_10_14_0_8_um_filter_53_9]|nr:MAG: 50S ribosomal protein L17 [Alphaproteobacteria bacterium CG_4_10_14_0_8_um_filter_53_9]